MRHSCEWSIPTVSIRQPHRPRILIGVRLRVLRHFHSRNKL
nr:MAG TPA: hypothetical protein [Caudoviricetes sp.]